MGDERVETLVHRICWDRLDLDKLRSTIVDTLTDDALTADEADEETREAWGDEEQLTILRIIYLALIDADVDIARVRDIDQRTDRAERGPHYFNLVMIMYSAWSQRWREARLSESDAAETPAGVTGMQAATEMRGLLQQIRGVCVSMHVE